MSRISRIEPWDLNVTYNLIRKAYGAKQERLAHASIRSVIDRQNFARYHYGEVQRLKRAFEGKYLREGILLDIYTQEGEFKRRAFEVFMIKAGAHATAAIQCVHAIPDTLAHALYYSTGQGLSSSALKEWDISINSVKKIFASVPELAVFSKALCKARTGEPWRHLDAAANTSKHRSVIRTTLSEDWTGTRKNLRQIHVTAFERNGNQYPPLTLKSLLEPEYNRLSKLVFEVGHSLTAHLRAIEG